MFTPAAPASRRRIGPMGVPSRASSRKTTPPRSACTNPQPSPFHSKAIAPWARPPIGTATGSPIGSQQGSSGSRSGASSQSSASSSSLGRPSGPGSGTGSTGSGSSGSAGPMSRMPMSRMGSGPPSRSVGPSSSLDGLTEWLAKHESARAAVMAMTVSAVRSDLVFRSDLVSSRPDRHGPPCRKDGCALGY